MQSIETSGIVHWTDELSCTEKIAISILSSVYLSNADSGLHSLGFSAIQKFLFMVECWVFLIFRA